MDALNWLVDVLTLSRLSIVLAVVAVYVTWRIGLIADRSLRNATTIGQSGVSQILRYLERRDHGTPEQAMDYGADVWTCEASPAFVAQQGSVTLRLQVFAGSSEYHSADESGLVRCTVTTPSGVRVFANTKPSKDKDYECFWEIAFPANFHDNQKEPLGDTNTAGVYLAEWDGLPGDQTRTTTFAVMPPSLGWIQSLRDLLLSS